MKACSLPLPKQEIPSALHKRWDLGHLDVPVKIYESLSTLPWSFKTGRRENHLPSYRLLVSILPK